MKVGRRKSALVWCLANSEILKSFPVGHGPKPRALQQGTLLPHLSAFLCKLLMGKKNCSLKQGWPWFWSPISVAFPGTCLTLLVCPYWSPSFVSVIYGLSSTNHGHSSNMPTVYLDSHFYALVHLLHGLWGLLPTTCLGWGWGLLCPFDSWTYSNLS